MKVFIVHTLAPRGTSELDGYAAGSTFPAYECSSRAMIQSRFVKPLGTFTVLVAVYFVAGKLGLRLAFAHPNATAVWPPTGLALAAFLILGYRVWPAIFVSAFLVNITTAGSVASSIGIGIGNTLEGLIGAYLVNRFAGGRDVLTHTENLFRFTVVAVLSTTVSATCGVTSLALAGFASWADFRSIWLTWWLGDMAGDLVIAPVLLTWSVRPQVEWRREKLTEAIVLFACLLLVGEVVFGGLFPSEYQELSIGIPLHPLHALGSISLRAARDGDSSSLAFGERHLGNVAWLRTPSCGRLRTSLCSCYKRTWALLP